MPILLSAVLSTLGSMFLSRAVVELEHMALRHQIGVLKALCEETAEADSRRPSVVGVPLPGLGPLAFGAGHRQARGGDRLASQGISSLLDLEDPAWPGGSARHFLRGPRSDPQDEPRKPAMGHAPYPLGIAQTGPRDQ